MTNYTAQIGYAAYYAQTVAPSPATPESMITTLTELLRRHTQFGYRNIWIFSTYCGLDQGPASLEDTGRLVAEAGFGPPISTERVRRIVMKGFHHLGSPRLRTAARHIGFNAARRKNGGVRYNAVVAEIFGDR